ncbi:MAG: type IX secretion system membrane protein PorP/SprF [Cryomorphaceae bacterium]
MKRFFLIALLSFLSSQLLAQQNAQYTNFLFNSFAINPANAGLKECLDARAGFRTQWVGFEGNPTTVSVNAHQRLNKISSSTQTIHGAGIIVEADNAGPSSTTRVKGAYAIHLSLGRKVRLSFGVSLGVLQHRFDVSQINVSQPGDPLLQESNSELAFPDLGAGVWMYSKYWFVGLSGSQLTSPTLTDLGEVYSFQPHYNLMAGRIFESGEKMSYIPAAQLKFTSNSSAAFDVNFWADYDNKVAAGLGFRSDDMVSGMLKFNFLDYFTIAYAYDFTFSKVRFGSSNSHEIIIGITACPRNDRGPGFVPCAAYD